MLETGKDMDPQSREILQTFVWWRAQTWCRWSFATYSAKVEKNRGRVYSFELFLRTTLTSMYVYEQAEGSKSSQICQIETAPYQNNGVFTPVHAQMLLV